MSKSIRLIYFGLIVFSILLVIGNWVTPVQANNANINTPMPTGTPIVQPEGGGEPVSPEQQTELKNVIQSYFDIRYRAFSALQLNEFGDLVSNSADAKKFLGLELGKLKVDLRNAELNHLRYVDYKYSLEYDNFAFDPQTQTATAELVEENDVIYEISEELNPQNPDVSHLYNLKHTITLRQENSQWKIVSDEYNDYLWRMLKQSGKSASEVLNTMKASPRPTQSVNPGTATILAALPDDDSIHAYDRVGAVNYALQHISVYNPDYPTYQGLGGDCTNFVSQSIYEGGNASMYIPSPLPPPSPNGQSGWYLLNEGQRATDWNDVGGFYDFVTSYGFPTEGPEGSEVQIGSLMLGDVIEYDFEGDGLWDHAVIVVDIINGVPYVASHTADVGPQPYTYFAPYTNIRFIHIERSDGVPPAKTKILLGSDDAGTNPTGCGFSSTDNEVYLGACSGSGNITSGFRFTNMPIPKKAQMKYAYINFTVDGTYTAPLSLNIYGEDTGNSATFTGSSTPANRSTPYSPISWNITDQWDLGLRRTSPDLSSVIQNIVNRSDWVNGNSLSVIIKNAGSNVRRVIAYERASSDPSLSPAKVLSTYTVTTTQVTYNSVASKDGWILESTETSSVGGSNNSNTNTFNVGDDSSNKQYRSILHFDTSGLPNNAFVISAILKVKQQSITGTNPFTTHGNLVADIKKPNFGTNANLTNSDFEDTPGLSGIAMFDSTPSNSWYSTILNSTAFPYINLTGTTQFRLAFTLDDNNDLGADYITFSSGNDSANAPQLIINYYVPAP